MVQLQSGPPKFFRLIELKEIKVLTEQTSNFNDWIYKRVYRIFKGKKKILAFANNNNFSDFWGINCVESGVSSCSVHLHNFLIISKGHIKNDQKFSKNTIKYVLDAGAPKSW